MDKSVSSTTKFILIGEFIFAVYMLIALTTSQYNSYKIEKYIEEFERQNENLVSENEDLQDKYDYFTSSEYQEKIAKQNFGLINPGEEVLIIPEKSSITDAEKFQNEVISERIRFYQGLSNPVKWWYFFFS